MLATEHQFSSQSLSIKGNVACNTLSILALYRKSNYVTPNLSNRYLFKLITFCMFWSKYMCDVCNTLSTVPAVLFLSCLCASSRRESAASPFVKGTCGGSHVTFFSTSPVLTAKKTTSGSTNESHQSPSSPKKKHVHIILGKTHSSVEYKEHIKEHSLDQIASFASSYYTILITIPAEFSFPPSR